MSFLNIWALAIAGAVIPALLILYFLKLRRREQFVPSTFLWKRAVQDLQVNAPFQRLRKNLLLFLQLLILAAAIVALARPIVKSTAVNEKSIVLLIDRSASMNTFEGRETRLDLAKEQATRLVRTLNQTSGGWLSFAGARAGPRVMVIAFADRASIVAPFTTNTGELVDLIRGIEPTDGRTNLREALDLAEAHLMPSMGSVDSTPVSPEPDAKLVLISDGGVADLDELVLRGGKMELLRIGETRDNVGITALRAERNYERPELLDVFVQARNFAPQEVRTDVALYVDDVLQDAQNITLAAAVAEIPPRPAPAADEESAAVTQPASRGGGDGVSLAFQLVLPRGAVLEARVARDDALKTDNRAYVVVPPPRKMRVLVVTERGGLLPHVLRGLPLEEAVFMTPAEYEAAPSDPIESAGQSKYDAVIVHNHTTKRLPGGSYLFLGAVPEVEGVKTGPAVENFALMWWDDSHAVLRNVALEDVKVARAVKLETPREAEVIIEGPAGPVLARYAVGGRVFLILSFAVEESTWWRNAGFPIFIYNALQFLGNVATGGEQGPARPGDALLIPLPAGKSTARLIRPNGTTTTLTANAVGAAAFGGADQVGVYRVENGVEGRDRFAVNLEDPWESDITPQGDVRIGGQAVAQADAIRVATPEIWRWFVGAAFLVALFEWWIYNRRVMI